LLIFPSNPASQLEEVMTNNTKKALVVMIGGWFSSIAANGQSLPNLYPFPNASGVLETYNADGKPIDLTGPFFQSLGTNGRSCGSCHRPAQGWSISADEIKARFETTQGLDPFSGPMTAPSVTTISTPLHWVDVVRHTAF
jgi:hypothetical protein